MISYFISLIIFIICIYYVIIAEYYYGFIRAIFTKNSELVDCFKNIDLSYKIFKQNVGAFNCLIEIDVMEDIAIIIVSYL